MQDFRNVECSFQQPRGSLMGWFKVDDNIIDHPKMIKAGELVGGHYGRARALAVFIAGGVYSATYNHEGYVPASVVRLWSVWERTPAKVVAALVAAGLWHPDVNGFRIHDYNDYNPTAEQVAQKQAHWRERTARYRNRHTRGVS